MRLSRRQFLEIAAGAGAWSAVSNRARAESYPVRAVRIVVGYTPGGSTDIIARVVGHRLQEKFGPPFIIENRPGAGANIGTELVVRAAADGYTLLLVNSADTINATLYRRLSFNFLRDIAPVASLVRQPQVVLTNLSLPANSVPELIAYAKANPGKVTMASAGNGTIGHLSGEMLKMMTGMDLIHVPYRGASPALTDLIAGHVEVLFTGMTGSIEYSKAGKVRALAVTTRERSDALPDVPTVAESVPGYEAVSLFGVGAPKNTATTIIDTLNQEINTALARPDMAARVAELGGTVLTGSPAEFAAILASETEKWGKVIRAANITSG